MHLTQRIKGKIKRELKKRVPRVIFDKERELGRLDIKQPTYKCDYNKEEISRKYVLTGATGHKFLDVGGGEGDLNYLLGVTDNLNFDSHLLEKNRARFDEQYDYFALDLNPGADNVIYGDICTTDFLNNWQKQIEQFDTIYSNNVFEHLEKPWLAAENIFKLLKVGGVCITIVPFAARYHESPGDYFRYTHKGLVSLFQSAGSIEVLESGYDIVGRRNNWQGSGEHNDIVPVDKFGAWRENWYSILIFRKL